MNRNANSRFATNPTNIDMSRSKFARHQSIKTTFNTGDVVPFFVDEVLPGDTFQIDTSKIVRLQTLLNPIMDNIFLDTYYFFVPQRLTWEHSKQFFGENTESAWIPTTEYEIPQLTSPADTGWAVGSIADYMGIPTGVPNLSVNALPFRAYALICDQWFRDENLTDPLNIYLGDATQAGSNGTNATNDYISNTALGGKPFKAAKYFDYFTGALPGPQKGPSVTISVGQMEGHVFGNGKSLGLALGDLNNKYGVIMGGQNDLRVSANAFNKTLPTTSGQNGAYPENPGTYWPMGVPSKAMLDADGLDYSSTGLTVDVNGSSLITINELRQAFQIQKFYEKLARGGSRYVEILKSMFGVTSDDARLQRTEYLGGNRVTISVNQVVQTSATSDTPQGNIAAYSHTIDRHSDFTKSFTEHGYIIGVLVARYPHSYQQGIERMWSRKSRFDYYWPLFANLGEQAILNKEIYAQGTAEDDKVFGYQEYAAEYRYKPDRVCGEMRSQYAQSLDSWHLADDYSSLPHLSDSWIREDSSNVDRVIAVSERVADQFLADIYVQNYTTRCMPLYSIPGLIDHH